MVKNITKHNKAQHSSDINLKLNQRLTWACIPHLIIHVQIVFNQFSFTSTQSKNFQIDFFNVHLHTNVVKHCCGEVTMTNEFTLNNQVFKLSSIIQTKRYMQYNLTKCILQITYGNDLPEFQTTRFDWSIPILSIIWTFFL